jgi:pilus assembly protein Flp/PilA
MKQLSKIIPGAIKRFIRDEEGAQVVEYALIIAVVSIALVLAIQGLTNGNFADFIARVDACLTTATCV